MGDSCAILFFSCAGVAQLVEQQQTCPSLEVRRGGGRNGESGIFIWWNYEALNWDMFYFLKKVQNCLQCVHTSKLYGMG